MRSAPAAAALAALAASACSRPRPPDALAPGPDQVRLSVLAWNVGRLHGGWDSRASDAHMAAAARAIERTQPDFVALQEVRGARQLAALVGRLGGRYRGAVSDQHGYDRYSALLVREALAPDFSTVVSATRRAWQAATVKVADGPTVTVASVHLDAFDARRRQRQADELAAWSEAVAGDVVLAGDFNFDAERAAQAPAGAADQAAYARIVRRHADLGRQGGGTTVIGLRYDYLFARSARLRRARVTPRPDLRVNTMDHDPVLGVLLLDRRPAVL